MIHANQDTPRTVHADTIDNSLGSTESFWLLDISDKQIYQSVFTLALVTQNAYWYVENDLNIDSIALERSATYFEENIYPTLTRVFGTEWKPGIDNDKRLSILNATLGGVAGYFRSADEYPDSIVTRSNQREMIYINAQDIPPGSSNYHKILSHELLHAIHWNADASEDTWVNEGLAELASNMILRSISPIQQFQQSGPVSLVHWPTSSGGSIAYYGAASLFIHFFTEHYIGQDRLKDFLAQPEDGIEGINQYLEEQEYEANFNRIFEQWAAANILDKHLEPDGPILGYEKLEVSVKPTKNINGLKDQRSNMPQYAVEYTELNLESGRFQLSFTGNTDVDLLPVDTGNQGCWWSNSGDSIDSTLFSRIEIPNGSTANLEFEVWFEIEEHWDYLYLETSTDRGESWHVISTLETSHENPFGNAFGAGYTGRSIGWLTDSVDLTKFSGEDLWVRFQYITDDAIAGAGACLRNMSVLIDGTVTDEHDWKSQGFTFTHNVVPQHFQVQLLFLGERPQARKLNLDSKNYGKWTIDTPKDGQRLIISVGALAEKTREPAAYIISLEPPE